MFSFRFCATKANLISNCHIRFLESHKHSYQMLRSEVQTIFFETNFETSFSERFMVYSVVGVRFKCFRIMLMGSNTRTSIVYLSWKMQNNLFRWEFAKEQHVQKTTLLVVRHGLACFKCRRRLWASDFPSNSEE